MKINWRYWCRVTPKTLHHVMMEIILHLYDSIRVLLKLIEAKTNIYIFSIHITNTTSSVYSLYGQFSTINKRSIFFIYVVSLNILAWSSSVKMNSQRNCSLLHAKKKRTVMYFLRTLVSRLLYVIFLLWWLTWVSIISKKNGELLTS